MKKLLGIAFFLITGLAVAGQDPYLFLQSVSHASLSKNKDNTYTLTINNVPKYVGYFSSRPSRKAGLLPLNQFISLWNNRVIKDNFADNPPNVAIAMKPVKGDFQNMVAIVSNPTYENKTLTYQLRLISKDKINTGNMSHISMVFDDIIWNPGGFGN